MKPNTNNSHVLKWVDEYAKLCKPNDVYWCDGSLEEKKYLEDRAVSEGVLLKLNQDKLPGCYYHRSNQNDVARTENLTFICTYKREDCGPTNNWKAPQEAYARCKEILNGSMKGRTLYVVPFIMGPADSPFSKVGIELTDSIYVALNMRIMTRMGTVAYDHLAEDSDDFTKCIHGMADLDINNRLICHFPEDNAIWSVGSAYGGNALLGKKCLALRIASYLGKTEGWMAEHMLILGLEKNGKTHYVCAAFPSQCGKTNLAMLVPPEVMKEYKVFTVGDDIAWLRPGSDGRLWAVNPEAGFFGVAPGTSSNTNPVALKTIQSNTIYTNVALTLDNSVWWEGLGEAPQNLIDWKGDAWAPDHREPAAHPNSRFTAPGNQCPEISPEWENPQGVPISAIIFGGRRKVIKPLVYETFSWNHGAYTGATVSSETTAAATGKVGVVRRDPMAMKPFIGYHVGDYFQHWIEMGKAIPNPPKIFNVNWFRCDESGRIMWPGFGENLRVLDWMLKRVDGEVDAIKTPIGFIPNVKDLNLKGLDISDEAIHKLLKVDKEEWLGVFKGQNELFDPIGERLPKEFRDEQEALRSRLENC